MIRAAALLLFFVALGISAYFTTTTSHQPHSSGIVDPPAPALTVRLLDVGQGDATYIRNGDSRIFIDGGPDDRRLGKILDSLGIRDTVIDVVILSHAHYDHYKGLQALFESKRRIKVRYFFENQDPSPVKALATLRDSVLARMDRDSLVYRDTDDPCGDGRPVCTITLRGGAKLHVLKPLGPPQDANNRSAAVRLVGPDSASFSMWLAGDAEHEAIRYFSRTGYPLRPGMHVDVLKANHHGSCNGVTQQYLRATRPDWVIVSLAAKNDYGHMHEQAKATYRTAGIPWYRTDQNGTITIRAPGTPSSGYTISVERGVPSMTGPSDRKARQARCE